MTSHKPVPVRTAPTPAKTHPSVATLVASLLLLHASNAAALIESMQTSQLDRYSLSTQPHELLSEEDLKKKAE